MIIDPTSAALDTDELTSALLDWVAIPSISIDPAHGGDVTRSAVWLARTLSRWGYPTVKLLRAGGHPAVYAEWPASDRDAPTALVYGHHDVQPADDAQRWGRPPLEPTLVDGRVFGRGASDDKGQVLAYARSVPVHLRATGRSAPLVTVKLLIEGEEESGSPTLSALLATHDRLLGCDVIVVADSAIGSPAAPTIGIGARGMAGVQVDVHGAGVDLHSGLYGGAVRNPLTELVRALGGLHDTQGRVAVPGFYDTVRRPTPSERDLAREHDRLSRHPLPAGATAHGEHGYTTTERIWLRPTAEINALWSGYQGPGFSTFVPASAHARFSFRLVPEQRPQDITDLVTRWLRDALPQGLTCSVIPRPGLLPTAGDPSHPTVQCVRRAVETVFGVAARYVREGGSGPDAILAEALKAPVVSLGFALPEDGWHSADESIAVDMLRLGSRTAAHLWEELATLDRR